MAPHHVSGVKDGWPTRRAGIENCEQGLQVAIQIACRDDLSAQLQQVIAGVPPMMDDPRGKHPGAASRDDDSLPADLSAQRPGLYNPLFTLIEMDVGRRPVMAGGQGAVDDQDTLAASITDASHAERLTRVAVHQFQEGAHCLLWCKRALERVDGRQRLFE